MTLAVLTDMMSHPCAILENDGYDLPKNVKTILIAHATVIHKSRNTVGIGQNGVSRTVENVEAPRVT